MTVPPLLELIDVQKQYQGLRPLRIQALAISPGERVAVLNVDAGAAEVLVNLVTGAGLPDRGEVRVMGQRTADIAGGDEWLASLDRFGIVSERAVLLEGATLEQNLALPFTLHIDAIPPDVRARVVALAGECGIPTAGLSQVAGDVPADVRARAHLAKALALDPMLLILEHPTALVPESARQAFARDIVRATEPRGLGALIITQDQAFATDAAHRALKLEPGTGALRPVRKGWFR